MPSGRADDLAVPRADSDDCGQRFRLKLDADSSRRRTLIPMIPEGVVIDVGYGVR